MVIPIVVFHSGIWNEKHCYMNYIMIFEDFVDLILKEICLNADTSSIELSTLLEFVVEIHEDKDVAWFWL